MTVYDRWHKSRPRPDEEKCKCRPAKVPTAEHGVGDRWQVRYRDDSGQQRKKNFERQPGALTFDAEVKASLDKGEYIDRAAGEVTFATYAKEWRAGRTGDLGTLQQVDSRLKKWVYGQPVGRQSMTALAKKPALVREWIKVMDETLAPGSIKLVVDMATAIFATAVEDRIVNRNPLVLKSVLAVRPVETDPKKVIPWTLAQVQAMSDALPGRLRAMAFLGSGCGRRQGELFGIAEEDVDFTSGMVYVNRQVRLINNQLVFSLPKRNKTRSGPLPAPVAARLREHIDRYPPVAVTLPWRKPDGEPTTFNLIFANAQGHAHHRNSFNYTWRTALEAAAIVPPTRKGVKRKPYPQQGCHVLRHTAASAWLAAGVDIVTVAEFLGHDDPGFTLRTYTHLMPSAADRARKAMETFFADVPCALDVP